MVAERWDAYTGEIVQVDKNPFITVTIQAIDLEGHTLYKKMLYVSLYKIPESGGDPIP